jgi:hypothetical protein
MSRAAVHSHPAGLPPSDNRMGTLLAVLYRLSGQRGPEAVAMASGRSRHLRSLTK